MIRAFLSALAKPWHARVLGLALGALALPGVGHPDAVNNLEQLGVGLHNGGNDLTQLAIALHDTSYAPGDGSVRFLLGDGSVRFISIGPDTHASLCFHNVTTTGDIRDGTSNTIVFSEHAGLSFTGGTLTGVSNPRDVLDGTSNTIFVPELPLTQFCVGDVTNLDPLPTVLDGTDNTITFGEGSTLDLCFSQAGLPPLIQDGTSNTIVLGEVRNNVCVTDVAAAPDLAVVSTVPEPAPLWLGLVPFAALLCRRRSSHAGLDEGENWPRAGQG